MTQVFDRALKGKAFSSDEIATMREAYLAACAALQISDNAERRRVAKIVQKISRIEALPAAAILARLAIDWYLSELAHD